MRKSSGILLFRRYSHEPEYFIVHPGGPFWKKKETRAWSIPKGEFTTEDPLAAAVREFEEETGIQLKGEFFPLTPVKLKSGKMIYAWALEGDADPGAIRSNEFSMEWPPGSGKTIMVPEVDKAGWFTAEKASGLLHAAQVSFITEIKEKIDQGKI